MTGDDNIILAASNFSESIQANGVSVESQQEQAFTHPFPPGRHIGGIDYLNARITTGILATPLYQASVGKYCIFFHIG